MHVISIYNYISVCVLYYTPAAEVRTNRTNYTVYEDEGQVEFWIDLICGQVVTPDLECEITIETVDGSAIGKLKFHSLSERTLQFPTFSHTYTSPR